jgi:transposase
LLILWTCGVIDLYFADETGFTTQPYVPYGWQKKGEQVQIGSRTKSKRLNVFGLMRLDNHLTVYSSEANLTGNFIVKSLTDFVGKAHAKPVVIVWDNGPIHRCGAVYEQQSCWEDQDVYLFFLPSYSPHLNPIEILWRFMKYRWLTKVAYRSWSRLKTLIRQLIQDFGSTYRINFEELTTKNITQFNSA